MRNKMLKVVNKDTTLLTLLIALVLTGLLAIGLIAYIIIELIS
jgi:hypothetical protein